MEGKVMHRIIYIAITLGLALLTAQPAAWGASKIADKQPQPPVGRLIIKFDGASYKGETAEPTARRVTALALATGIDMRATRALSGGTQLVHVKRSMPPAELAAMAARLSRQPGVAYAEPDARRYTALMPNDPEFVDQY